MLEVKQHKQYPKILNSLYLKGPNNNIVFIFFAGSGSGAGILPETGSSAAFPGEMPEGKETGASTAACRRGTSFYPKPHNWVSPFHLAIRLLHQTCLLNRYQHKLGFF